MLYHFAILYDLRIFAECIYEVDPFFFISQLTTLLLCVVTHTQRSGLHQNSIISNSTILFSCLLELPDPSFYFYSSKIDAINFAIYFISGFFQGIQNTMDNVYIINSNTDIINYSNVNNHSCSYKLGTI